MPGSVWRVCHKYCESFGAWPNHEMYRVARKTNLSPMPSKPPHTHTHTHTYTHTHTNTLTQTLTFQIEKVNLNNCSVLERMGSSDHMHLTIMYCMYLPLVVGLQKGENESVHK